MSQAWWRLTLVVVAGCSALWCEAASVTEGRNESAAEVAAMQVVAETLWSLPAAFATEEDEAEGAPRHVLLGWPKSSVGENAPWVQISGWRPDAVRVERFSAGDALQVNAIIPERGEAFSLRIVPSEGSFELTTSRGTRRGVASPRAIESAALPGLPRRVSVSCGAHSPRGLLIWGNGAGGDAVGTHHARLWREFAEHFGFALVTTRWFGNAIGGEQGRELLDAIEAIGRARGMPGWSKLPIVFTGHSNGGQMAYQFNASFPEQVIAFTVSKGGYYRTVGAVSAAAMRTPALMVVGERDLVRRALAIHRIFTLGRLHEAPWALWWEQGVGHDFGRVADVWLPFFAWAIERHFAGTVVDEPETPWIADNFTWQEGLTALQPAASELSRVAETSWLPTRTVALAYRGAATFDNPLTLEWSAPERIVAREDPVTVRVKAADWTQFRRVELWCNGESVAVITPEQPFWSPSRPQRSGVFSLVAIGWFHDGRERTSAPVSWLVADQP